MKTKLLILLLIILLIAISIYQLPRRFYSELVGYEISHYQNISAIEQTIVFDGWVKNSLFGKDKFMGTIYIGDCKISIRNYINIGENYGPGQVLHYIDTSGDFSAFGTFYSTKRLSEVMILIYEEGDENSKSFGSDKGRIFISPAKTTDLSIEMANRMLANTFFENIHIKK